ncbi:MAG: hypothetical protein JSR59_21300 [Proteobacteria bacterium]|nr:hypothetical protein [Pseudomonadota bacterium]
MTTAPLLRVLGVGLGVRPVRLRRPFRFGAVTLTASPELYVHATVEVAGRGTADGHAAEMMVPKWFDKRSDRSRADNVRDLASSIARAGDAYAGDAPATPFGLHGRHYAALMQAGARDGATELSSAYGQAVLDRAVLDAACRVLGVSFFEAARRNLLGLVDTGLAPDLHGHDWNGWLAARVPPRSIAVRHTVGMLDALDGDEGLAAEIARQGLTHFKIKLGGDPATDMARLDAVLDVLDASAPGHRYTLDGNEQYADPAALAELLARLATLPEARRNALLYLEQPMPREQSLAGPVPATGVPLLMDEADGTLASFAQGAALGWRGVSSKGCKGLYKAIVNRARCDRLNDGTPGRCFMSAEDLTCQAGLGVQQDLALVALLGLAHSERNGHHYGDGFNGAPMAEQQAFAAAHPDLYVEGDDGRPRLRIANGRLAIDSLDAPGYAHVADPDRSALRPLADAPTLV